MSRLSSENPKFGLWSGVPWATSRMLIVLTVMHMMACNCGRLRDSAGLNAKATENLALSVRLIGVRHTYLPYCLGRPRYGANQSDAAYCTRVVSPLGILNILITLGAG